MSKEKPPTEKATDFSEAAAVWLDISQLKEWDNNPRKNDPAVAGVAKSIQKFGFGAPILARKHNMEVIAGHTRLKAAKKLGLHKVPVRILDLNAEEAHMLALADNRLGENAEWDEPMLAAVLADLQQKDQDLDLSGFDSKELDALLDDEIPVTEDVAPVDQALELQKKWGTEIGQLWQVGKHRILCGDSTKPEDVARLFEGQPKAKMMATDPPYGIDYSKLKNGIPGSGFRDHTATFGNIENDELTSGPELQAFLESQIRAGLAYLEPNAAFYLWHPMLTQGTFFAAAAAAAADILIHRQIIWVKPGFVLTRSGMYHWQHELCFYGWIRGNKPPWYGDKSQTSVWQLGRDDDSGMHPTQKPIELFIRPMQNHTQKGDVVFEPFSGSGSQLVAAERMGRTCLAIELDPKYVAVALERLSAIGCDPKLLRGKAAA